VVRQRQRRRERCSLGGAAAAVATDAEQGPLPFVRPRVDPPGLAFEAYASRTGSGDLQPPPGVCGALGYGAVLRACAQHAATLAPSEHRLPTRARIFVRVPLESGMAPTSAHSFTLRSKWNRAASDGSSRAAAPILRDIRVCDPSMSERFQSIGGASCLLRALPPAPGGVRKRPRRSLCSRLTARTILNHPRLEDALASKLGAKSE
jgi:hypothetical protein